MAIPETTALGKIPGEKYTNNAEQIDWSNTMTNKPENAEEFVDDVLNFLIYFPLNQNTKERLLQTLLDGSVKEDWSTYSDGADARLIKFFKVVTRLPEFQLIQNTMKRREFLKRAGIISGGATAFSLSGLPI